jgi:hypothetical protein
MHPRILPLTLATAAAIVIAACRGTPGPGPTAQGDAPTITSRDAEARAHSIRLEPYQSVDHLYRDEKSQLPYTVRLVVQDSADWRAVWKRILPKNGDATLPPMDFTREMLIVAGMGEKPCLGYHINVDTVFRDDEKRIYAVVRERQRGAKCGCLNEVVSPVDIIKVPRTIRPVTFIERKETNVCEEQR